MKIHFDIENFEENWFAIELAKQFFQLNHVVDTSSENADVSLIFNHQTSDKLAPKIVQRIEYTEQSNIKKIIDTYEQSDSVIWASEFGRQSTQLTSKNKQEVLIRDGIVVNPIKEQTLLPIHDLKQNFETMFVCENSAENILEYIFLQKNHTSNCLFVLPSNKKVKQVASPFIFYVNDIDELQRLEIISAASWTIDVEIKETSSVIALQSLSQRTPVIYSNVGVTKEYVNDFGILSSKDLLLPTVDKFSDINLDSINIEYVAKKYLEVFQ